MKFFSDAPKFLYSCFCAVILTGFLIGCIYERYWVGMVICFLLDLFFIYNLVMRGSIVYMDEDHVEQRFLGRAKLSYSWAELAEVGSINDKYLYFSPVKMSDEQRFEMCLHWPPKGKICLWAKKERQARLHRYLAQWDGGIVEYATDKIKLL